MPLKGCHRRTVCIKCNDGCLFEEAFFLLRAESEEKNDEDILTEAKRIVDETLPHRRRKTAPRRPLLSFLFGALCASLVWFLCVVFLFF